MTEKAILLVNIFWDAYGPSYKLVSYQNLYWFLISMFLLKDEHAYH